MREDMAKVLVERPRLGGGTKYPRGADRGHFDEQPHREGIKSPKLKRPKSLNENLAPLRRFLRSRLGTRWDAVYSEICERINRDSAVQLHIWQHLMWEVQRDPRKVEALLAGRRSWGWSQFYVDPKSRRLCESPRVRRVHSPTVPFLTERDGRAYKQVDGIWYEIETAPLGEHVDRVWDAVLSRPEAHPYGYIDRATILRKYGKPIYAARKRQLNKKEIRSLTADR